MPLDAAQLESLLDASEPELVALGRTLAADQQQAFGVLTKFLDDQITDERALDLVCSVIRGIASVAPLESHRELYRDVYRAASDPLTIRPPAIKALALALAMPQLEYYVRVHGRPLLRRVYELRKQRDLSPDVVDALVTLGVDWALPDIDSLEDAWAILIATCTTEEVDVVSAGGLVNIWERMAGDTVLAGDAALAGFIRNHPGVLETAVLEHIDTLAAMPTTDRARHVLDQLFETGFSMGPRRWTQTHGVWDPTLGLRVFSQAQTRGLFGGTTVHNSFHVARRWLDRDPAGFEGLCPEMVDAFRGLIEGAPLPEILPAELDQQSPEQIEEALARYCGITIEQLYRRLLPGSLASGGFIQPDTHLGQLIHDDAATLRSLGLSRHELADRIAELIPPPTMEWHEQPPFQLWAAAAMGHQQDPFHIYDVYDLNGHLGSRDFRIVHGEREIRGGDLQLSLIRRACFFGGPGCYRIDPAAAVEILGLR
jgi:hypothetical protein